MKIGWKAIWETVKFILRMVVLGIPVIVALFNGMGKIEWAATASAILIIVDKLIHELEKIPTDSFWSFINGLKGLLPF